MSLSRISITALAQRKPWQRLACFLAIDVFCVIAYLALFSIFSHGKDGQAIPTASLAPLLLTGALLTFNLVFLRAEGWTPAAIGLNQPRRRAKQFLLGFGGGCILVFGWAIILMVCTGSHWHWANSFHPATAVPILLFTFLLGASEELAYRAYALLRIGESYGAFAAVFGTSLLFTVMHVQGGMPWLNAIAGVFTCALVYSVIFLRCRSVWLVVGFHVANNVAQNLIGLRDSPLTLIEPVGGNVSAGGWVLVLVAALNVGVAAFLWPGIFSSPKRSANFIAKSVRDSG